MNHPYKGESSPYNGKRFNEFLLMVENGIEENWINPESMIAAREISRISADSPDIATAVYMAYCYGYLVAGNIEPREQPAEGGGLRTTPIDHEELVSEAQEICGLAFTLQTALDSPSWSDHFTAAARILSDKMIEFTEQLKALDGEGAEA